MVQREGPGAAGFLAVDGGNLYYEVEGAGEALLLIHGWLGDLRMWDFQAQALAGSYRVVRCDMRGFGRSTTERVEFAYWADVAALLDHLGVESSSHCRPVVRRYDRIDPVPPLFPEVFSRR